MITRSPACAASPTDVGTLWHRAGSFGGRVMCKGARCPTLVGESRGMRFIALSFVVCQAAAGPYAGSTLCTPCHRAQAESHAGTGHSQALAPAALHLLYNRLPLRSEFRRAPGFRFRFDGLTVRVDNGADVLAVPIEWAFGAGQQAVTFVSRGNERFYLEHYLSYYSALRTFAPTPGHSKLKPANLAEAAGLLYKVGDSQAGIDGCFECHSTGGLDANLKPAEAGVHCESCHGPAAAHVSAPSQGNVTNPGRSSAASLNDLCGRCHRPPASDPAKIDWNFAWNVRHQPVYLSQSACFMKSRGRLTCLTCHAAHEPLRREATAYDARCLGCHDTRPPACAPRGCPDCHMPRVSPEPPLRFTNHWIGVYGAGAKLKPRPRVPR